LVNERTLDVQKTNTHLDVVSGNLGFVDGSKVVLGDGGDAHGWKSKGGSGGSLTTGNNSLGNDSLSASNGVITAQQNTGFDALQQSSVSIGAQVGNGTIGK
ncbi:MAG: hypothetical protein ACLPJJ_01745, partial [Acidocella sp.]|uniref:hypothetical protein n=1 Tax=Acidocella sp. TaxID=50710 RepID=UPI003FD6D9F1